MGKPLLGSPLGMTSYTLESGRRFVFYMTVGELNNLNHGTVNAVSSNCVYDDYIIEHIFVIIRNRKCYVKKALTWLD